MSKLMCFIMYILTIIFISTSVAGQNSMPSEWTNAGFGEYDARSWINNGFSLPEAQQWMIAGFSLYNATSWKKNGFTIEQAKLWGQIGVKDGRNISGIGYEEAKSWHSIGVKSNEWLEYKKFGIDLNQATEWARLGITSLYEIKNLLKIGIDLNSAKLWNESGLNHNDWDKWKMAGYSSDDAKTWSALGINSFYQVNELKKAGIDISVAKQWYESKLEATNWIKWHIAGISPQEAKGWVSIDVKSLSGVQDFIRSGNNLSEATSWKQVGVSDYLDIIKLKKEGINNPAEKKGWDSIGISDVTGWVKNGLTWQEAKEWKENGFDQINEVLDWKAKGFVPSKAKEQDQIDRQRAIEKKNTEERNQIIIKTILKIVFFIVASIVIIGIYLGVTDKAVFYMDKEDLLLSFAPYPMFIITALLSMYTWEWVGYVGWIATTIVVVMVFYRSFTYNNSFIKSISTAVAKLLLSLVYVINIMETLMPSGKNVSEKRFKRSTAFVWLVFLTPLLSRLINGERAVAKMQAQSP